MPCDCTGVGTSFTVAQPFSAHHTVAATAQQTPAASCATVKQSSCRKTCFARGLRYSTAPTPVPGGTKSGSSERTTADRDRGPDQALRHLHRGGQRVLHRRARRGAGLPRPQRRRQVHHHAHAGRLHDPDRRHRAHLRPRRADRRRRRAAQARLPARGRADLSRNDGRRLPALLRPHPRLSRRANCTSGSSRRSA